MAHSQILERELVQRLHGGGAERERVAAEEAGQRGASGLRWRE